MAEYTIYLSEPLRKIGDYADTVDSSGTVTRRVKKLVLDGTEYWIKNAPSNPNNYLYYLTGFSGNKTCVCSHLEDMETLSASKIGVFNYNSVLYINFGSSVMTAQTSGNTITGLKEYLSNQYSSGTPVCVWYVLATATTESITAPTIATTAGSNTLSIGTTLQPSEVSITGGIK